MVDYYIDLHPVPSTVGLHLSSAPADHEAQIWCRFYYDPVTDYNAAAPSLSLQSPETISLLHR